MRELPIAKEGIILVGFSLLFSLIFFLLNQRFLFILFFLIFLFFLFFFRNPKRSLTDESKETLISPADGRVLEIRETKEEKFTGMEMQKISIFMSPFDVHVNRSPCDGKVEKIEKKAGTFSLAFKKKADENEKNFVLIDNDGEPILLVQIAGYLARRIFCYVKEKDTIKKGEPLGMIAFGSRVDVYLPKKYEILTKKGQRVKAGITKIAKKEGQ